MYSKSKTFFSDRKNLMKSKKYQLFDTTKLESIRTSKFRDGSDSAKKLRLYAERLDKIGYMRELVQAPAISALAKLERDMPNFSEVIIFVRRQIALSRLGPAGERAMGMLPILLEGSPGIGKTRFVQQLAKALRVEFHEISFATTTATFVLKGGSLQWGEGQAGRIFDILADCAHMNPMVLLDEIDKFLTGNYSPVNVLYEVLEPNQAKRFQDEALGDVHLDASRIMWVLTANEPRLIPAAIISRCRVFDIPEPTKEQMRRVAQSVYRDVLVGQPWAFKFERMLRVDVVNKLYAMAPREIRKVIMDGLGWAAERGLNRITPDSIPELDKSKKIGF